MNKKIKLLRETVGLTETDISRFLNISSYKYTAFENNKTNIPLEILALLSIMYSIPIDIIIDKKYTKSDLLIFLESHSLLHLPKDKIIKSITQNLIGFEGKKISYKDISSLKKKMQQNAINNINKIIEENNITTIIFANRTNIKCDSLKSILLKKRFLTTNEILKISKEFSTSTSDILFNNL